MWTCGEQLHSDEDEDEEAAPRGDASPAGGGAAPAGRPRRALDLEEDPDDDLPIGWLRVAAGGGAVGGAASTQGNRATLYTVTLVTKC